jgi:hypothetical protein
MELKVIEEKTFEKLKMCIADLLGQIDTLFVEPTNGWIDNQTVCQALNVSKRTLQSFRDKGLIPYSQIGHKCFYKQEDMKEFIEKHRVELLEKA